MEADLFVGKSVEAKFLETVFSQSSSSRARGDVKN